MYNPFQLITKYLHYYLKASNSKGHGVHSPFVFDFITKVLNDDTKYPCYLTVENKRNEFLGDKRVIEVEDYGAGSTKLKETRRKISAIAQTSVKKKKWGQLLFRIAQYYSINSVLELGTSLGITTSYLAHGAERVFSIEGAPQVAKVASESFHQQKLENISLYTGSFETQLPVVFHELANVDMVFIDGHHLKIPTLAYFSQISRFVHNDSIIIFDDIHWSKEMEQAWEEVKSYDGVKLSIDLFFIGLVFFNSNFKEKQHFSIRF